MLDIQHGDVAGGRKSASYMSDFMGWEDIEYGDNIVFDKDVGAFSFHLMTDFYEGVPEDFNEEVDETEWYIRVSDKGYANGWNGMWWEPLGIHNLDGAIEAAEGFIENFFMFYGEHMMNLANQKNADLWNGLDGADEVKYNILMDYYFESDAPMWEEEWLGSLEWALENIGSQIGARFWKTDNGLFVGKVLEETFNDEPPLTIISGADIYEWYEEELIKVYNKYASRIHDAWFMWKEFKDDDDPNYWFNLYGLKEDAVKALVDKADELARGIHDEAYDWYSADEVVSEWWNDEYMRDVWYEDERYAPYRNARRKQTLFGTVACFRQLRRD